MTEPERTAIVDADGKVSTIDSADVDNAVSLEGARVATRDEYDLAKEMARPGSQLAAGAAGVMRGMSLGLSDPLLGGVAGAIGGSQADKQSMINTLRHLKEGYEGTSTAGELGGIGLTLGAGTLGRGVARAATPLGEALGGSVMAGGRSILGAGIKQAIPEALQGAYEMGLMGAGKEVSEETLGNHDLNGEKILAAGGMNAIYGLVGGGLIGGGIGASGQVLREGGEAIVRGKDAIMAQLGKFKAADIDALATKKFGTSAPGLGEKIHETLSRASAAVSGKDYEAIKFFSNPANKEARQIAAFDAPQILEQTTRDVTEAGNTMLDRMGREGIVSQYAKGQMKFEQVAKAVKVGNELETASMAQKNIDALLGTSDDLIRSGAGGRLSTTAESLSRSAYSAQAKIAEAIGEASEKTNAKIFQALDQMKREVGSVVFPGERSVLNIADPVERGLAMDAMRTYKGHYESLRTGLESESMWGAMGPKQQEINAAWSKLIDSQSAFHGSLTTEVGQNAKRVMDPSRVGGFMRGITNPEKDLVHTSVKSYVGATEDFANMLAKHYDLPQEALAEITKTGEAAKAFRGSLDKATESATLVNQYRELMGQGAGAGAITTGLGFLAGGPLGAAAGAAVGALVNPGKAIASMASVERMIAKVDAKAGGALSGFFKGGEGAAKTASPKLTSAAVRELAQNPSVAMTRIQEVIGDFADQAPKIAQSMGTASMRAITYLSLNAPKEPEPRSYLRVGGARPSSVAQKAAFEKRAEAVLDPTGTLEKLKTGQLSREHVEAIKFVYPNLYEQMKADAFRMARDSSDLPIQKLVRLSVLFDAPLTPGMRPEIMQQLQQAYAQNQAAQQQQSAPQAPSRPVSTFSKAHETATDRLEKGQ